MILQIAFRNFTRNARRFLLLGCAVAAGFFFVSTIQSVVAGLSNQINIRGARYYGGHVIISPAPDQPAPAGSAEQERFIQEAIRKAGVHPAAVSHRTHFGADGVVFFNGESVRIRRVIGMDWAAERSRILELEWVSGAPNDMQDPAGVLISEVTARRLGAKVGDQIILQVNRDGGALNTIPLWVRAIFREVSIFGYFTVYMDRSALDLALGKDPQYSATVGLYLDDYRQAGRVTGRLAAYLGGQFTVKPVIQFMPEIRTMLEALTLVSYGILLLLSIIVAVGILNMYRVIIYERTREIGTMRAIGIQRSQVRNIVLMEALFLGLFSVVAGLGLSALGLAAISLLPISGAAGFDIFLHRGHLSWVIYADTLAADALLIIGITILGAVSPARAAQAIDPVVALRAE